jgi:hypothetical protein
LEGLGKARAALGGLERAAEKYAGPKSMVGGLGRFLGSQALRSLAALAELAEFAKLAEFSEVL